MTKIGRTHQRKEKKMKILRTVKPADDDPTDTRTWEIIHGHCVTVIGHPRWYTPSYEARQSPAVSDVKLIFADPPYNEAIAYGSHYDDDLEPEVYREKAGYWFESVSVIVLKKKTLVSGWLAMALNQIHEWAYGHCAEEEKKKKLNRTGSTTSCISTACGGGKKSIVPSTTGPPPGPARRAPRRPPPLSSFKHTASCPPSLSSPLGPYGPSLLPSSSSALRPSLHFSPGRRRPAGGEGVNTSISTDGISSIDA